MNLVTRIVLFIFSLLVLVLAIGALGVAVGWDPELTFLAVNQWLVASRVEAGLIGLIALGLAILAVVLVFRKSEDVPTIIKETNLGTIRISLQAVETLIKRAAGEIDGVRGIHSKLRMVDGELGIDLALEVAPDTNIPELADKVQTRVKEYLAHTVGITGATIGLTVREIAAQPKARVK
ncbi:MAG: alkaline shock response membrane anchor protein AmaP [Firmicutes bacterium]|nr:alkaline shock response membrane anchor protein AmaP [Bacillota bacterium]